MKTFRSLADFANHLTALAVEAPAVTNHVTEKGAELIQRIAKAEIGHYQPAVGPFARWEQLAPATEAEKRRLGFKQNAPLERTGAMRDSIERTVVGNRGSVGSNDQKMVWHELGTQHVPARAVLGPAAIRAGEGLQARFGLTIAAWLSGRGWRNPRLK